MKKCAETNNYTIRGKQDIGDGQTPKYYDCILHKDNFNYSTKKLLFQHQINDILTIDIIR